MNNQESYENNTQNVQSSTQNNIEHNNNSVQVNIEMNQEQIQLIENIEQVQICTMAQEKLNQEQEKALKKAKKRIFIIKELVNTEEKFVNKLRIIENNLKRGLEKLLSEHEIKIIFSNSTQILGFNEDLLGYFLEKTKNLELNSSVLDELVLKKIPFFQIYKEYLQNYEDSNNYLNELIRKRKDIQKFCQEFERIYESIQSLLIIPLQRLTKYPLLFKELLDVTLNDHQDYIHIVACKQQFKDVCSKINESIQKHLDNQKICELSQSFKDFNLNLIEHKKQYQFEVSLTLIEGEKNCIVNFFADLILVSEKFEQGSTQPLGFLTLNYLSSVKPLEDMNGVENDFTFMAQNEKEKTKTINNITQLINNLGQKNKQDLINQVNIEVNVLGTEKRNSTPIYSFTVYVTEVKISGISLKIQVRYSQLSKLEITIKQNIKDIEIDHFSTKMSWIQSQSTKTIERRKVLVESFLKKILTIKKIKESVIMKDILKEIGLPKDFYELPFNSCIQINYQNTKLEDYESDEDCDDKCFNYENSGNNISIFQSSNGDQNGTFNGRESEFENQQTRQKQKSKSLIAIGTLSMSQTLKMHKKSANSYARRESVQSPDIFSQNERCLIDVELPDGSKQEIEINSQTQCQSICAKIAKKINLKSHHDYKIFLKDSQGNLKVQDDDYTIFKTLFPDLKSFRKNAVLVSNDNNISINLSSNQSPISQNTSLYRYSIKDDKEENGFLKFFRQFKFNLSEKYTIVFKKYLWLSYLQEEYNIRKDPIRLRFVRHQMFSDIYKQQYNLTLEEYALFSSLYIFIIYGDEAENLFKTSENQDQKLSQSIPFHKIKEVIPEIIFQSQNESFWVKQIREQLKMVNKELSKILLKNQRNVQKRLQPLNGQIFLSQNISSEGQNKNNHSNMIQSQNLNQSQNIDLSQYTCQKILTDKICLMQIALFNALKKKQLFGVTLFYVKTYKKTLKEFQNLTDNVWLCIKKNMLYIRCPQNKTNFFEIEYERLESIKQYNDKIQLITKNPRQEFEFVTKQFFEIKQLIEEYQQINELLASPKAQGILNSQTS